MNHESKKQEKAGKSMKRPDFLTKCLLLAIGLGLSVAVLNALVNP